MRVVDATSAIFQEISVSFSALRSRFISPRRLLIPCSDDLTVEVIFFGNSDKSGDVVINREASAVANDVKAKL